MPVPQENTDYVGEGLGYLTSQFTAEDAPQLRALITAFLNQCQELETALWQVIKLRQLANLTIYSPVPNLTVTNGSREVTCPSDLTGIVVGGAYSGGTWLTFANDPTQTPYYVESAELVGDTFVIFLYFVLGYQGPSGITSATQPVNNPLMDTVGALVGQPRNGNNDLSYLSFIYLRIAINHSYGIDPNWSAFAGILMRTAGGPVAWQEGMAAFRLSIWVMMLDPISTARALTDAVPNGVRGQFGYTTWADGNDYTFTSRYYPGAGQGSGFGSRYDTYHGALFPSGSLLVAGSSLPPI